MVCETFEIENCAVSKCIMERKRILIRESGERDYHGKLI